MGVATLFPDDDALAARCRARLALAADDIGAFARHYREDVAALLRERDPIRVDHGDGRSFEGDVKGLRRIADHDDFRDVAYGFLSALLHRVADRLDPEKKIQVTP